MRLGPTIFDPASLFFFLHFVDVVLSLHQKLKLRQLILIFGFVVANFSFLLHFTTK